MSKEGKHTYRCGDPACKVTAEIDWGRRTKTVTLRSESSHRAFPTHAGCELAKGLDEIDPENLVEVR